MPKKLLSMYEQFAGDLFPCNIQCGFPKTPTCKNPLIMCQ